MKNAHLPNEKPGSQKWKTDPVHDPDVSEAPAPCLALTAREPHLLGSGFQAEPAARERIWHKF